MKNVYFIINKQPNQTWEQWENKRTEGEEITIPWNWKFDRARKAMKKYKKKGLCKQIRGNRGLDVFKWVGKKQLSIHIIGRSAYKQNTTNYD